MSRFRPIDRNTDILLPPSVQEWLPEAHLARYLACNRHPDHDTLATFRRRFGKQFESAFVQVLQSRSREPVLELRHGQPRRHQDTRQRQPA